MVSKNNVVLIVFLFVFSIFYLTYDIYIVSSHNTCQIIEVSTDIDVLHMPDSC